MKGLLQRLLLLQERVPTHVNPRTEGGFLIFLSTSCERIISCLQDKAFFKQQSEMLSTSMNISQHQWDCYSQMKKGGGMWGMNNWSIRHYPRKPESQNLKCETSPTPIKLGLMSSQGYSTSFDFKWFITLLCVMVSKFSSSMHLN